MHSMEISLCVQRVAPWLFVVCMELQRAQHGSMTLFRGPLLKDRWCRSPCAFVLS